MVEPSKIEEECRRRARINFENNRAWGRKGQEWALEAEHDWQAAEAIASLQKELAERTKERDEFERSLIGQNEATVRANAAFVAATARADALAQEGGETRLILETQDHQMAVLAALMPDVLHILANNKLDGDKTAGELADRIRAALGDRP